MKVTLSPSEENKLYDLTAKQKLVALGTIELKELLRLARKKAKQTSFLNQRKSSN
jgi:hypothetical protein